MRILTQEKCIYESRLPLNTMESLTVKADIRVHHTVIKAIHSNFDLRIISFSLARSLSFLSHILSRFPIDGNNDGSSDGFLVVDGNGGSSGESF